MERRRFLLAAVAAGVGGCMSGRQLTDVEQMLLNEHRALDRAIAQRERVIAELEKRASALGVAAIDRRPKRYSVEFEFTPESGRIAAHAQEKSFFVDTGATFHCATIESSLRVVGDASVASGGGVYIAGQTAVLTLPYSPPTSANGRQANGRNEFFEYLWKIRDTGSDREWQNLPMPSVFMDSGAISPLVLPVHGRVGGGSEVFVEITPVLTLPSPGVSSVTGIFRNIYKYILHISLAGTEVPE